jgi:hypothetical protein
MAYAGAKSIPMNLIMMYMSGNSLQIFSILITVMMFWNPVKALMNVRQSSYFIVDRSRMSVLASRFFVLTVNFETKQKLEIHASRFAH